MHNKLTLLDIVSRLPRGKQQAAGCNRIYKIAYCYLHILKLLHLLLYHAVHSEKLKPCTPCHHNTHMQD